MVETTIILAIISVVIGLFGLVRRMVLAYLLYHVQLADSYADEAVKKLRAIVEREKELSDGVALFLLFVADMAGNQKFARNAIKQSIRRSKRLNEVDATKLVLDSEIKMLSKESKRDLQKAMKAAAAASTYHMPFLGVFARALVMTPPSAATVKTSTPNRSVKTVTGGVEKPIPPIRVRDHMGVMGERVSLISAAKNVELYFSRNAVRREDDHAAAA